MAKLKVEKRSPLKEKPLRLPGQSVQEQLDHLLNDVVADRAIVVGITAVMLMTALIQLLLSVPPRLMVIVTALYFVGSILYALPKILKARREANYLKLGRDGERIVAETLDEVKGDGAFVLHDLVAGDFNLDHVVISRKGIFAIETKTRSKREGNPKVTFDGERILIDGMRPFDNPLGQVRGTADWLRRTLKKWTGQEFNVKPVVVFPGWFVEPNPKVHLSDAWVLEPKALAKYIMNEPIKLTEAQVHMVKASLESFCRSS